MQVVIKGPIVFTVSDLRPGTLFWIDTPFFSG
jgi:hypothetical protein